MAEGVYGFEALAEDAVDFWESKGPQSLLNRAAADQLRNAGLTEEQIMKIFGGIPRPINSCEFDEDPRDIDRSAA